MIDTAHRQAAVQLGATFAERAAAISADHRLTEAHRRSRLAAEYLGYQRQLANLRRQHDAEVAKKRSELEHSAYGHWDTSALRSALDSASARISTAAQAKAALRRAERVGDDVAACATFVLASEMGWAGVVGEYAATHPGRAASLTFLDDHDVAASDDHERLFSPFFPRKPDTLRNVDDSRLEELANASAQHPDAAREPGLWGSSRA